MAKVGPSALISLDLSFSFISTSEALNLLSIMGSSNYFSHVFQVILQNN